VVVRYALGDAESVVVFSRHDGEASKRLTDVIGIVQNVTAQGITLRKDAAGYQRKLAGQGASPEFSPEAELVTVPWTEVVVLKQVPPRPVAREIAPIGHK